MNQQKKIKRVLIVSVFILCTGLGIFLLLENILENEREEHYQMPNNGMVALVLETPNLGELKLEKMREEIAQFIESTGALEKGSTIYSGGLAGPRLRFVFEPKETKALSQIKELLANRGWLELNAKEPNGKIQHTILDNR